MIELADDQLLVTPGPRRGGAVRRRHAAQSAVLEPILVTAVIGVCHQRELDELVSRLERGDVPLDEALALWERGEALYRACAEQLDRAELRIEELRLGERGVD